MQVNRTALFTILFIWSLSSLAQNSTSSPSSRFGYGEMVDNIPTAYRAMGGVSTGLRTASAINPSQPASYTACDSMSFMFDIAGSVMWTQYKDSKGARNRANGNLEYVTVQFPIWKQHIAFSAGVMPYSVVGYNFALRNKTEQGSHAYTVQYAGEGGITQVYGGLSFNILNWVALGANFYYMFGDATNVTSLSFDEYNLTGVMMYRNMHVSSFRFRYGLQAFHTFADNHEVVLGAVFENRSRLRGTYSQYELMTLDTIPVDQDGFQVPMYYSVGVSYGYAQRLLVAVDYSCHAWSKADYFGAKNSFSDRHRCALGLSYRHNPFARNYAHRMTWRVGASLQDSYVRQKNIYDFSVTMGLGFPFRTTATMLNFAVEYNRRKSIENLVENNLKFTIAVGVNESWFFKRKL